MKPSRLSSRLWRSDPTNVRIFDIKRYSLHDGPGIRTTVFFMGCPLRCAWCHNPESQDYDTSYLFISEKCLSCGECGGNPGYDCLRGARKTAGYDISLDDLLREVDKDRLFYEESGGGVTFSGGEPLAQPEALLALLEQCQARDIPVCLDTSGYLRPDNPAEDAVLRQIGNLCSRILFDIKILDPEKHKLFTGGDLEMVLHTLSVFLTGETPIEVRMPLIPGVNCDEASRRERENFLRDIYRDYPGKILKTTCLSYHESGRHKYGELGRTYPLDELIKDTL